VSFDVFLKVLLDPDKYEFNIRCTTERLFDFARAFERDRQLAELIFYVCGFIFYQARCIEDGDWPNRDCRQWEGLLTGVV